MIKNFLQTIWSKVVDGKKKEELGFMCCFCNKEITSLDPDPSDINIIANIDKPKSQQADQFFYCHTQCLKKELHEDLKSLFVVDQVTE